MRVSRWFGRAFCTVGASRPEYATGHRGATFTFACAAPTLLECASLVCSEAVENQLEVRGFEYLMQEEFMDRDISPYEVELAEQLPVYPVQFKNVHFFLPES